MISLILLKLLTFSQILQGVPKLSSSTICMYVYACVCVYIHKLFLIFFIIIPLKRYLQVFLLLCKISYLYNLFS